MIYKLALASIELMIISHITSHIKKLHNEYKKDTSINFRTNPQDKSACTYCNRLQVTHPDNHDFICNTELNYGNKFIDYYIILYIMCSHKSGCIWHDVCVETFIQMYIQNVAISYKS